MKKLLITMLLVVLFAFNSFAETVPIVEVDELPPMDKYAGFVFHEEIPLDYGLQELLWHECIDYGVDYAFALAVIQKESEFTPKATNHNSNGSTDKGIFQTNSCWWEQLIKKGMITCSDDLYDAETGIKCGMWELSKYVVKYGNTERAYAAYNTGRDVKSNKNSRKVVEYWEQWKGVVE